MGWVIGILAGIIIGYLLDREIYFYEGVHLGPRAQAWLYDRWAKKYDAGKSVSQQRDNEMLARPLLNKLKEIPEPFILDFAAGTGRLSFALLNEPGFNGHIVAVDLSLGMLEQAVRKIKGRDDPAPTNRLNQGGHIGPPLPGSNVEFLRHLSLPLPFPDATFDAVCALEVLELFPDMDRPMKELTRLLRPGGILLTSRGTEASGRRAKVRSQIEFAALLEWNGLVEVEITPWWKLFDRVIAEKNGSSEPVAGKNLSEVLRCVTCNQFGWMEEAGSWVCRTCGKTLSVTEEGIVLN